METCVHCKQEIPAGACQQGQKIADKWYPLHVGCADAWGAEKILVYLVDWEGDNRHTEADLDTVKSYLNDLEDGQEINIECAEMARLEYLTLPEE